MERSYQTRFKSMAQPTIVTAGDIKKLIEEFRKDVLAEDKVTGIRIRNPSPWRPMFEMMKGPDGVWVRKETNE